MQDSKSNELSKPWVFLGGFFAAIFLIDIAIVGSLQTSQRVQWSTILANLFLIGGGIFAIWRYLHELSHRNSEKYLDAARQLLDQAVELLKPRNDEVAPRNDRLLWITAAQAIYDAHKLKELLAPDHLVLFRHHARYSRLKLYAILSEDSGVVKFPDDYVAISPKHMISYKKSERATLHEGSLCTVFRFAHSGCV